MAKLRVFPNQQGDPLSPTLFVIAAEALSRGLNALNRHEKFKGFGLPKWSTTINHLAYADDTIPFVSAEKKSTKLMNKVLNKYESASGQMINLSKSDFMFMKKNPGIVAMIKKKSHSNQARYFSFYLLRMPNFVWKK